MWITILILVEVFTIVNLFTFYSYHEMQQKALYLAEKEFLSQQVEQYAVQLQNMGRMENRFIVTLFIYDIGR